VKGIRPVFQRLALGATVGLLATLVYRSIQHVAAEQAVVRAECWSWHWLPFSAEWLWPYLSMFVLVGLPWFLLPDLRSVRRFALTLVATAAVGWIVFLLHPTACLRPGPEGQPFYYTALLALDRPNNCLPCLHSAFSVLAAWVLASGGGPGRHWLCRLLLLAWLLLICVSIVALRQHTDLDTLAGVALGCAGAWTWVPAVNTKSP
jgi:membrane-associated phospholipid phosphatase